MKSKSVTSDCADGPQSLYQLISNCSQDSDVRISALIWHQNVYHHLAFTVEEAVNCVELTA